jgi:ABC-type branched-subunit amino acid transport system substrate-binding protein
MKRVGGLLCVLVLVSAMGCGSRVSRDEIAANQAAGGGSGVEGGVESPSDGNGAAADGTGADGKVGTLEAGCGEGDAAGATDVGVADDQIGIATISDKAGVVQVPTVGIEESVKAFVAYCNSLGGINGRPLELTAYDSKIGAHAEATKEACDNDNVFALVGTGSVLDEQGAQEMVDCGLVEVGAYAASAKKALSERFFNPIPNPANLYSLGPCRYIAEQFPDAAENAGIVYTDLATASDRAKVLIEGCTEAGFDFVYEKPIGIGEANFGSIVSEMQSEGVRYVTIVASTTEGQNLLLAMQDQGFEPEVIDFGQQYYDPALAESPGAEGAYVLTNTAPFEEADSNPALQVYLHWLEEAVPGAAPTTLGVQAFSAGLLFAQAMKELGSDVTRDGLLAQLATITEWDGGGLHMATNPGENAVNNCFLYLRVKDGAFERHHPEEGYDCDPGYAYELELDVGSGAKAGG